MMTPSWACTDSACAISVCLVRTENITQPQIPPDLCLICLCPVAVWPCFPSSIPAKVVRPSSELNRRKLEWSDRGFPTLPSRMMSLPSPMLLYWPLKTSKLTRDCSILKIKQMFECSFSAWLPALLHLPQTDSLLLQHGAKVCLRFELWGHPSDLWHSWNTMEWKKCELTRWPRLKPVRSGTVQACRQQTWILWNLVVMCFPSVKLVIDCPVWFWCALTNS